MKDAPDFGLHPLNGHFGTSIGLRLISSRSGVEN
jgi:hypothetical protein